MPPGFTAPFARRLDHLCQLRVQEACDGQVLGPGIALIGPAGSHMSVERGTAAGLLVRLSLEPGGMLHIPSVDVLMNSAAAMCGDRAVGVILTGMGCDGAQGIHALYSRGAMTIGQDEHSCVVYGMPRACAEQGTLQKILPLDSIPLDLMAMVNSSGSQR